MFEILDEIYIKENIKENIPSFFTIKTFFIPPINLFIFQ